MRAILTIQGDEGRDTWEAVKREAQAISDSRPLGWQLVSIRAEPKSHKVVLELTREDEE